MFVPPHRWRHIKSNPLKLKLMQNFATMTVAMIWYSFHQHVSRPPVGLETWGYPRIIGCCRLSAPSSILKHSTALFAATWKWTECHNFALLSRGMYITFTCLPECRRFLPNHSGMGFSQNRTHIVTWRYIDGDSGGLKVREIIIWGGHWTSPPPPIPQAQALHPAAQELSGRGGGTGLEVEG